MQRDGACTSLWQPTVADYVNLNKGTVPQSADVVIAGGGITGITTALELQKAGLRCVVAEMANLCFGTTGGTTAHINSFFDTPYDTIISDFGEEGAQRLAVLAEQARQLFSRNVETYNIDCGYAVKDGYVYSRDAHQTASLESLFKASERAGVAVRYTDQIPVPIAFDKAIVFPGQAQIHPTRYVMALARAFEEAGGTIITGCSINGAEKNGDTLRVETNKGSIASRYLIYATHIPPGINLLHLRCAPYRSYAMAVTLSNEDYPEGLAYDMYDPYHYYRTQEIDGKKYLIAGGEDHKTGHETNTEGCLNRLEAHVRSHFKVAEVVYRWSSQYYEPADGLAYIGQMPETTDNVLVATGFGGNGISYSHIAALVLTQLITRGENEFTRLFHPGRIKPVAGFRSFVQENADVAKEFVSKRLSVQKLEALAGLAPGEGNVVRYEDQKLAIYKDEKGNIHAVHPVCTHAKCIVAWNDAEKSWDCPCHGARYSVDGTVLTGPARKGLDKADILAD